MVACIASARVTLGLPLSIWKTHFSQQVVHVHVRVCVCVCARARVCVCKCVPPVRACVCVLRKFCNGATSHQALFWQMSRKHKATCCMLSGFAPWTFKIFSLQSATFSLLRRCVSFHNYQAKGQHRRGRERERESNLPALTQQGLRFCYPFVTGCPRQPNILSVRSPVSGTKQTSAIAIPCCRPNPWQQQRQIITSNTNGWWYKCKWRSS